MYRNVPVISWAAQRGRAACCDVGIPRWYVTAEIATVAAAVAVALTPAHWVGGLFGVALATGVLWYWHRERFGAARSHDVG